MVIDCDRGHCYEHLKKKYDNENWALDIYLNVCICDKFELPEMAKKWNFGLFRRNLPQLGLFHPYFVCKSSFRAISMIKMVIWDQSKPILLIFEKKESKIKKKKLYIARLLFIKMEIRKIYNPF